VLGVEAGEGWILEDWGAGCATTRHAHATNACDECVRRMRARHAHDECEMRTTNAYFDCPPNASTECVRRMRTTNAYDECVRRMRMTNAFMY
jgi:hypothetical protein